MTHKWHVRDDDAKFEKIIYSDTDDDRTKEFVARVYAGPNRDTYADEIVRLHNASLGVICGCCGQPWQEGMSCGQKDNGWPFETCYAVGV